MARGGPLIVTGMVQILRNGAPLGVPLPAHFEFMDTEEMTPAGPIAYYDVELPPNTRLVEADRLQVLTCPSNPAMVTTLATAWSVANPQPYGGLIPRTMCRGYMLSVTDPDTGAVVPVYPRANCVIAIDRYAGGNNGALPASQTTAIPARWQAPSSEMVQALGDSAMPALYVDPGVDLRQGDGVTIASGVGYSPLPPFLAGRYPVRMVSPTLGAIPMTMAHLDAKVAQ